MAARPPNYICLAEAARRTPGHHHPSSIWRWCRRGVKARDDTRVYLRHRRFGSRVWTTTEWLNEFADELARRDQVRFGGVPEGSVLRHK